MTQQIPGDFRCKRELRSSVTAKPKARLCEPWVMVFGYSEPRSGDGQSREAATERINRQADLLMPSPLAGLNRSN
jgi:hypothetical protein